MPTTPNKGIEIPTTGTLSGTWGDVINVSSFTVIDTNLGGTVTKTLSNVDVTLSASEGRNGIVRLIGTLSGNVTITNPNIGFYYVENATTGDFLVTMQYTGAVGGTIKAPQGMTVPVISDGTNGLRLGSSGLPPGSIIDYAGTGTRWTGEYLLCDGSAVSRTTYSALFQAISTTWGVGNGSTTFNVPDLRGRATFGRDDMGGSAASRITSAGSGIVGTTIGATGGAQNVTLTAANLPANIPNSASSTSTATSTVSGGTLGGTTTVSFLGGGSNTTPTTSASVTVATSVSTSTTVTINSSGGTTTTKVVPPLGIVNKLIKL